MLGDNHFDKDGKPQDAGHQPGELIEEIKWMDEAALSFRALMSSQ